MSSLFQGSEVDNALAPPMEMPKKAKRKRITTEQLEHLVALFEKTDTPSFEIREGLAKKLGMSNREIQVWFQNRRAKANRVKINEQAALQHQQHLQHQQMQAQMQLHHQRPGYGPPGQIHSAPGTPVQQSGGPMHHGLRPSPGENGNGNGGYYFGSNGSSPPHHPGPMIMPNPVPRRPSVTARHSASKRPSSLYNIGSHSHMMQTQYLQQQQHQQQQQQRELHHQQHQHHHHQQAQAQQVHLQQFQQQQQQHQQQQQQQPHPHPQQQQQQQQSQPQLHHPQHHSHPHGHSRSHSTSSPYAHPNYSNHSHSHDMLPTLAQPSPSSASSGSSQRSSMLPPPIKIAPVQIRIGSGPERGAAHERTPSGGGGPGSAGASMSPVSPAGSHGYQNGGHPQYSNGHGSVAHRDSGSSGSGSFLSPQPPQSQHGHGHNSVYSPTTELYEMSLNSPGSKSPNMALPLPNHSNGGHRSHSPGSVDDSEMSTAPTPRPRSSGGASMAVRRSGDLTPMYDEAQDNLEMDKRLQITDEPESAIDILAYAAACVQESEGQDPDVADKKDRRMTIGGPQALMNGGGSSATANDNKARRQSVPTWDTKYVGRDVLMPPVAEDQNRAEATTGQKRQVDVEMHSPPQPPQDSEPEEWSGANNGGATREGARLSLLQGAKVFADSTYASPTRRPRPMTYSGSGFMYNHNEEQYMNQHLSYSRGSPRRMSFRQPVDSGSSQFQRGLPRSRRSSTTTGSASNHSMPVLPPIINEGQLMSAAEVPSPQFTGSRLSSYSSYSHEDSGGDSPGSESWRNSREYIETGGPREDGDEEEDDETTVNRTRAAKRRSGNANAFFACSPNGDSLGFGGVRNLRESVLPILPVALPYANGSYRNSDGSDHNGSKEGSSSRWPMEDHSQPQSQIHSPLLSSAPDTPPQHHHQYQSSTDSRPDDLRKVKRQSEEDMEFRLRKVDLKQEDEPFQASNSYNNSSVTAGNSLSSIASPPGASNTVAEDEKISLPAIVSPSTSAQQHQQQPTLLPSLKAVVAGKEPEQKKKKSWRPWL